MIIGEYGCLKKNKETESRVLYLSSVAEYALKYGMCPVFWDNGEEINRVAMKWRTDGLREAMLDAKERGLSER